MVIIIVSTPHTQMKSLSLSPCKYTLLLSKMFEMVLICFTMFGKVYLALSTMISDGKVKPLFFLPHLSISMSN